VGVLGAEEAGAMKGTWYGLVNHRRQGVLDTGFKVKGLWGWKGSLWMLGSSVPVFGLGGFCSVLKVGWGVERTDGTHEFGNCENH